MKGDVILRKIITLAIILCTFALTGCVSLNALLSTNDINIDRKGVEVLLYNDLGKFYHFKDGIRHQIPVDDSSIYNSLHQMYFVNEEMGVIVSWNYLTYFSLVDQKILRTVNVENLLFAGLKGTNGDMYVIAGDTLSEYSYAEDKLIKPKQLENAKELTPKMTSKMVYCPERNSLFLALVGTNGAGIYELSLGDYALNLRFQGDAIEYVTAEKRLYFIGDDGLTINYAAAETLTVTPLYKSKSSLYSISVINQDIIMVNRASNGSYYAQNSMLLGGKMYYPLSRYNYNNAAVAVLRISDSIKAEWLKQYASK